MFADYRIGADLDVGRQPRATMHKRRRMYRCHDRGAT
jgi:hypothetical protein